MTKIKLCGLKRPVDIECVNDICPEYIGFVFATNSKRYVSPENAEVLRKSLKDGITPVGVFVDEKIEVIAELVDKHIIEVVQLHGNEDEDYISNLRKLVECKIIKAFKIEKTEDIDVANRTTADYVLLDSGGGTGETFDWSLIKKIERHYFLAGGLTPENVKVAIDELNPFAVDASSSLETEGVKNRDKMQKFVDAVRNNTEFCG